MARTIPPSYVALPIEQAGGLRTRDQAISRAKEIADATGRTAVVYQITAVVNGRQTEGPGAPLGSTQDASPAALQALHTAEDEKRAAEARARDADAGGGE